MKMHKVKVKFNLHQSKVHTYMSKTHKPVGVPVIVLNNDKTTAEGIVVECSEYTPAQYDGEIMAVRPYKYFFQKLEKSIMKKNMAIEPNVYDAYLNSVCNPGGESKDYVEKKMNRNVLLSPPILTRIPFTNLVVFKYGELNITVNLEKWKIVDLSNFNKPIEGWRQFKDDERKRELNRQFGITSSSRKGSKREFVVM